MTIATYEALLEQLRDAEERASLGGGRARLERHRRLGRLGARDRIAALVDAGSFFELGRDVVHRHGGRDALLAAHEHAGDGLVCGIARVGGARVIVYAHDPTVLRGALGHAASGKLIRALDLAYDERLPVIAFADSDGVRIGEGSDAVVAYGEVIARTIRLRKRVPQLTLVCGLCVGAAAYNAALTDFVGMVEAQSFMFITGPKVTEAVTGEHVSIEQLGGASLHSQITGSAHAVFTSEADGIGWLKMLLSLHAARTLDDSPTRATPEIEQLVPTMTRRAYDMRKVLHAVVDQGELFELSPRYAPNLITCFARMDGRAVAFVASQPMQRAGCLDIDASKKGAHFIRYANANGLPIITLADVPGYVPGQAQESGGILTFGAELLAAYGEATVPTVSLVVRKSYGGANVLSYASRLRLALPTAAVAPMGAEAAADVLAAEDREAFVLDWQARHETVWTSARDGYFDKVIAPVHTRRELCAALRALT